MTPWKANLLGECRAFPEGFKIFTAQLYKWCFANCLNSSLSYMQMGHVRFQLSQPGWKKEPAEWGEKPSPVLMESCPLCSWNAWQVGEPRARHTGALFPREAQERDSWQGCDGVVQLLIRLWLFVTPWAATHQASCPSLSPWVCSDSCSLSLWCHPTISSSVARFSSCLQSFPTSGSFPKAMLKVRKAPYQTPSSFLQSSPAL